MTEVIIAQMANKVPLDLSENEIQRRCDEIQQTWTDAVREQRRRGNMADGANRDPSSGPYTVPMIHTGGLPRELFG